MMNMNYNQTFNTMTNAAGSNICYARRMTASGREEEILRVEDKEYPLVRSLSQDQLETIGRLVRSSQVVLDDSVFLLHNIELLCAFFEGLYALLRTYGCSVIVAEEVYAKLEHVARNHASPYKRELAIRGMIWYRQLKASGLLIQVDRYRFEDGREYIMQATKATLLRMSEAMLIRREKGTPFVLISHSKELADDVLKLKSMNTVRQLSAEVFYVDVRGNVKPYVQNGSARQGATPVCRSHPRNEQAAAQVPRLRLTDIPAGLKALDKVSEGDRLTGADGQITLGAFINSGAEGKVFWVKEHPDQVAKVFEKISDRKAEKIIRMAGMKIPGVCMPLNVLRDGKGRVCGYTMKKIDGVALADLIDEKVRMRTVPSWDRSDFAAAACRLTEIGCQLLEHGLVPTDGNLENVVVCKDTDGYYNPRCMALIDADSFQMITREGMMIPGDGYAEDIVPPINGMYDDTIISRKDYAYILAIQAFIVCMGVHPFLARPDERYEDRSLAELSRMGRFPYGTQEIPATIAEPLEKWKRLYRAMDPRVQTLFAEYFSVSSPKREPEQRPDATELREAMRGYAGWIISCGTDPRARSFDPQEEDEDSCQGRRRNPRFRIGAWAKGA